MGFKLLSWNVEHFKGGDPARLERVVSHVKAQRPDVFGLLEMEGANVRQLMEEEFPNFDFFITDGPEVQEILVGCRRGVFDQKAFVQKREFKEGNPALRPGALLSVRQGAKWTNMLFLHTDSGIMPGDFGNRAEMFERLWKLERALAKTSKGDPRLVVIGDLNTMGMFFPTDRKADVRVPASLELRALADAAKLAGMKLLPKTESATWSNPTGTMVCDLDHVVASEGLAIASAVEVKGWQQLEGAQRKLFIQETSDHGSLALAVP